MFKNNVGERLLEAKKEDYKKDVVVLMRAVNIIRKEIFKKALYIHRTTDRLAL